MLKQFFAVYIRTASRLHRHHDHHHSFCGGGLTCSYLLWGHQANCSVANVTSSSFLFSPSLSIYTKALLWFGLLWLEYRIIHLTTQLSSLLKTTMHTPHQADILPIVICSYDETSLHDRMMKLPHCCWMEKRRWKWKTLCILKGGTVSFPSCHLLEQNDDKTFYHINFCKGIFCLKE